MLVRYEVLHRDILVESCRSCLASIRFSGVKPFEWRLLTNRVATDSAAVNELIGWYRARWEIEMLFNVLKNGCCVEELWLGTSIALSAHWRCTWWWRGASPHLMRKGRTCPDLDATLFFDPVNGKVSAAWYAKNDGTFCQPNWLRWPGLDVVLAPLIFDDAVDQEKVDWSELVSLLLSPLD